MADQEIWYYSHDGQDRQGPISWGKVQEYFKSGILSPETLIWAPHLSGWTPAQQLIRVKQGMGTVLKVVLVSIAVLVGLGVVGGITGAVKESQREEEARVIQARENEFFAKGLQLINRSHMKTMVRGYGSAFGKPHASVGRSLDFQDMVLATVVWPGSRMVQSMVDPNNPPQYIIPKETPGTRVDPSLTDWNCTIDEQGNILLKGSESHCIPR